MLRRPHKNPFTFRWLTYFISHLLMHVKKQSYSWKRRLRPKKKFKYYQKYSVLTETRTHINKQLISTLQLMFASRAGMQHSINVHVTGSYRMLRLKSVYSPICPPPTIHPSTHSLTPPPPDDTEGRGPNERTQSVTKIELVVPVLYTY